MAGIPDVKIVYAVSVSSEQEMLALAATVGDMVIREDLKKPFILVSPTPSSLDSWVQSSGGAGGGGGSGIIATISPDNPKLLRLSYPEASSPRPFVIRIPISS